MALTKEMREDVAGIDDEIDLATVNLEPEEAVEFLEALAANIEGKIDALKEENDLE